MYICEHLCVHIHILFHFILKDRPLQTVPGDAQKAGKGGWKTKVWWIPQPQCQECWGRLEPAQEPGRPWGLGGLGRDQQKQHHAWDRGHTRAGKEQFITQLQTECSTRLSMGPVQPRMTVSLEIPERRVGGWGAADSMSLATVPWQSLSCSMTWWGKSNTGKERQAQNLPKGCHGTLCLFSRERDAQKS